MGGAQYIYGYASRGDPFDDAPATHSGRYAATSPIEGEDKVARVIGVQRKARRLRAAL